MASSPSLVSFRAQVGVDPSTPPLLSSGSMRVTQEGPSSAQTREKTIYVYNEYRPGVARYYTLSEQQTAELRAYYDVLKQRVMPADAHGFIVNFSKQTASYIDAEGEKQVVYLTASDRDDDIAVRDVQQAAAHAEHLISKELYHGPVRMVSFLPGQKGSAGRPLPLGRPASLNDVRAQGNALDVLRQRATNADRGDERWERIAEMKQVRLEQLYAQREEFALEAEPDPEKVADVEERIRKGEALDDFAFQAVMMYYPGANARMEDVQRAAQALQRDLEEVLGPEHRAYAIEVGGLLFAGLPDAQSREAYCDYCEHYKLRMKPDRTEDQLIRSWFEHEREHGVPQSSSSTFYGSGPAMPHNSSDSEIEIDDEIEIVSSDDDNPSSHFFRPSNLSDDE